MYILGFQEMSYVSLNAGLIFEMTPYFNLLSLVPRLLLAAEVGLGTRLQITPLPPLHTSPIIFIFGTDVVIYNRDSL